MELRLPENHGVIATVTEAIRRLRNLRKCETSSAADFRPDRYFQSMGLLNMTHSVAEFIHRCTGLTPEVRETIESQFVAFSARFGSCSRIAESRRDSTGLGARICLNDLPQFVVEWSKSVSDGCHPIAERTFTGISDESDMSRTDTIHDKWISDRHAS